MVERADEPVAAEGPLTVPQSAPARSTRAGTIAYDLTVVEGVNGGVSVTSDGNPFFVGSHPLCRLVIRDPQVSRFHCELRADRHGVRLRDTDSLNGTKVDGVRVVEAFLENGSLIQLGQTVIRFRLADRTDELELSEAPRFQNLVAESTAMRHVFSQLERASAATATVLLEGETGTGKTAAARAIHERGPRSARPFVMVDCGAIPANLLEAELFGHERGAFTGADQRRIGAFEDADGGTLFLDEIGELPFELQPKLLSVLENRSVRRLGSNRPVPIDVRIVAATNRDLRGELNNGRFRPDLYFRLAVLRIEIPPLRARPDDLVPIARNLLTEMGASRAQINRLLDEASAARLVQAPWPGNLRELRNHLERCMVFDEPLPLLEVSGAPPDEDLAGLPFAQARTNALARFERTYLAELLTRHDGRVIDAAQAAGVDRTHFYRLMRRHGLGR